MKVLRKNPSFKTSESKKKSEKQEIEKAINFILCYKFQFHFKDFEKSIFLTNYFLKSKKILINNFYN